MASDVVIIDDEDPIVELVCINLSLRGIAVSSASLAEEGIELVMQEHPVLVLLDIRLPDMDGWKVCRILKTELNGGSPAVVFLSAAAQVEDRKRASEAGGDGFLLKPFEIKDLIAVVQKYLQR